LVSVDWQRFRGLVLEGYCLGTERTAAAGQRQVGFEGEKVNKTGNVGEFVGQFFPRNWIEKPGIGLWVKAETVR